MQKLVQLAPNLSEFDFWLVYHKKIFNFTGNLIFRPSYQKDAKFEDLTMKNILLL